MWYWIKHYQHRNITKRSWTWYPSALLGFSNPIGCIFAALFIGYMNVGGNYMQALNIAIEVIDIIVAVIIYFASFTLFIKALLERYQRNKKRKAEMQNEGGKTE